MRLTNRLLFTLFILLVLSAASILAARSDAIRVNMLGYTPDIDKYVVLVNQSASSFDVRRMSDDQIVYTGTFGSAINDAASGDTTRLGDFTSVTHPDTYRIEVGTDWSYEFEIDDEVYQEALYMALRGFYGQRCGMSVSIPYKGNTFSHGACHLNDHVFDGSTDKSGSKDLTRGWHDAGDYGKYALNSGITTGTLLLMYERYSDLFEAFNLDIPESGNGIPDVLNEIKWNLDWKLKMQETDAGENFGGVFHKTGPASFPPMDMMPHDDNDTYYIYNISSMATADFAAVMAIASRVFEPFDSSLAAQYLSAAQDAWGYLETHGTVPFDNSGGGSGHYPDDNDDDERLWAAVELYNTTGDSVYHDYVAEHYNDRPITIMSDNGDDWKELHPIAFCSYLQSPRSVNSSVYDFMRDAVKSHADELMDRINGLSPGSEGYRYILHPETGGYSPSDYYWGSNSVALNRAIRLLVVSDLFADDSYRQGAAEILHYMFGRNPFNSSYVTQFGDQYMRNPHHRPCVGDGIDEPWPGLLIGGPNAIYDSGLSSYDAKCYVDDDGSYTTNEIAINWQAAYTYVLAAFVPTPGPTNTPTDTPTSICWPYTCTPTETYTPTITPTPIDEIMVNAAGPQFSASDGVYAADQAYSTGSWGYTTPGSEADRTGVSVDNTVDDDLYLTERWAENIEYLFDNTGNGYFLVTLKFNEMFVNSSGARVFTVDVEGVTESVDVYALAGNSQAYAVDREYIVEVTDGQLNINLTQQVEMCILNAIKIETYYPPTNTPTNTFTITDTPAETYTFTFTPTDTDTPDPSWTDTYTHTPTHTFTDTDTPTETHTPTETPTLPPFTAIMVNAGGPDHTDSEGTWEADRAYSAGGWGYIGGTGADNSPAAVNDKDGNPLPDSTLYETERYDSPSYTFDNIPDGQYEVTMKFAELYWTDPGQRVFSVQIEGDTVISDLDLAGEYGNSVAHDVAVLVSVTDGQLNITSSALADSALFNAVKIEQYMPPTFTPTETFTYTYTAAETETETFTRTDTPTQTPTDTEIPQDTFTHTETPTDTSTQTETPRDTFTETETYTETHTPVETFTASETETETSLETETYTPEDTLTETFTETLTQTPTETHTETETPTPEDTYTFTHTSTDTHTPTFTDTPTHTATQTPTLEIQITDINPSVITSGTDTSADIDFDTAEALTRITVLLYTDMGAFVDSYAADENYSAGSNTAAISLVDSSAGIDFTEVPAGDYYIVITGEDGTYTGDSNSYSITVISAANTYTPTYTFTSTDTPTPTHTFTDTHTVTDTPTYTFTHTYTATHTMTYTYTPTHTHTETHTYTHTGTPEQTAPPTYTYTPTHEPTKDVLRITDVITYPNPYNPDAGQEITFAFDITRPDIERLSLRIYTVNYRLVRETVFEQGALEGALNSKKFNYPMGEFSRLANGIYFYILIAERKGEAARSNIGKLIVLK